MMLKSKKLLFTALFLISAWMLLLSGCCATCVTPPSHNLNRPCGYLIDSLYNQGVLVIAEGDSLRIIVPSDTFFLPASTKINPDHTAAFNTIAELLDCQCYGTMPIRVVGYTDNIDTIHSQKQRSYRQAHQVAALLWSEGISWERMSIQGMGARGTIASNMTPLGEGYNRRVEIFVP